MSTVVIDGIFAMLAAVGAASIVWMIAGIFINSGHCDGIKIYTVIMSVDENVKLKNAIDYVLWRNDVLPGDNEIIVCRDEEGMLIEDDLEKYRNRITVLNAKDICGYLHSQIAYIAVRDANGTGHNNIGRDC